ncbi:RimJ/RimL family protein N-acetyltransferase [Dokdonia sp. Hel_I_63]|uniref:GNAT family N-acetyltransferase n=1 Tax=Dokdonia sp. Hel_I_63 TaxID=1249996 RepID=UPI00119A4AB5|nr:GNAT family N-acetyltransferase [Dokdonia sp. Hel_I_63]TVZ22892.1 RimJ/RimL family protein N-acetyltransferase [Dokdonia sp. Hel_I_63]
MWLVVGFYSVTAAEIVSLIPMNHFPLTTERITLRPITIADLDVIHNLHSLPETDAYNALGIPENIAITKAIITPWIAENQQENITNHTLAIVRTEDHKFIGLYGLKIGSPKYQRAEIWYKIHRDYWNNGYATEATQCILDFCFDSQHLHRVAAGCAVENIGSYKVLEKVGMTREGRCRQILPLSTGWADNYEYAILENDPRKR